MWTARLDWSSPAWVLDPAAATPADLVLYFGARAALADPTAIEKLRLIYPTAHLLGCSTGGQIRGDEISDDCITALALRFDSTALRASVERVSQSASSRICGEKIGKALVGEGLAGLFVLSDGLNVNGSDLVAGIASQVGAVPITGGMAGDGAMFGETLVGLNEPPTSHVVAAVGFYGPNIHIGHGSAGGWDVFGPKRRITRSKGTLLVELDGRPALDLYERYLDEQDLKALPGSALFFPLKINDPSHPEHEIVRTVLAVDRQRRTLTFAGDMPEGWTAQLMRGTSTRLSLGAAAAAAQARDGLNEYRDQDGVAILISCIGRRLMMGQRTHEEIEAAGAVLGSQMRRFGFYSYGEISPHSASGICDLHNQTMTITTITEAAA